MTIYDTRCMYGYHLFKPDSRVGDPCNCGQTHWMVSGYKDWLKKMSDARAKRMRSSFKVLKGGKNEQ